MLLNSRRKCKPRLKRKLKPKLRRRHKHKPRLRLPSILQWLVLLPSRLLRFRLRPKLIQTTTGTKDAKK